MKTRLLSLSRCLAFAPGLCLCLAANSPGAEAPPPKALDSKDHAAAVCSSRSPQSVFIIPSHSSQGRDPFYPQSKRREQQPIGPKPGPVQDVSSSLVLNGLTGPPRRTAMINGYTFEKGESGEIRLSPSAKVVIKCVEISDTSAIILIGNQRRELRFRKSL